MTEFSFWSELFL